MTGAPQHLPPRDHPPEAGRGARRRQVAATAAVALALILAVMAVRPPAALATVAPTTAAGFSPAGVQPSATSTLTVTITNPAANGSSLTGVAFTDSLPANLTVAGPNGLTSTCGGTTTADPGSGSLSLTGGTVAAASSCEVAVDVTGAFTGAYVDSTGPVATTNGGTGGAAGATLTIANPPDLTTLFAPTSVPENASAQVSFTISNPNSQSAPPDVDVPLTGVGFSDTLPAGLAIANPANAFTDCGGALTAAPGAGVISLTGATIAPASDQANGDCSVAVDVAPTATGTFDNTTGTVAAAESGPGTTSNTASLDVTAPIDVAPPTLTEAMGAAAIPTAGTTSVTFTVSNPNRLTDLLDVGFGDPLPAGLQVADPNGAGGSCLSADAGTIAAGPGSDSITVGGITLPAGTACTITAAVTGTAAGLHANATQDVTARYDIDGNGELSAITGIGAGATLAVVGPPAASLAFGSPSIPVAGTTTVTVSLVNPAANPRALTGVGFGDALPAGLQVATSPAPATTCDGAVAAPAGSSSITLDGATLAVGATCTVAVAVTGTADGTAQDGTGAITSANGGTGPGATASLFVGSPPTVGVAVSPGRILVGQTSRLTITVGDPNAAAPLTGISLTTSLPPGLATAGPATTTCSGAVTDAAGGRGIGLSGAGLTGGARCAATVDLRATGRGVKTLTAGPPAAAQTPGGSAASATLIVVPDNRFRVAAIRTSAGGSVSITMRFPGSGTVALLTTAWRTDFTRRGHAVTAALLQPARGRFVFGRAGAAVGRGSVRLAVGPDRRSRGLVRRHARPIVLRLWITFMPSNGGRRTIGFHRVVIPRR